MSENMLNSSGSVTLAGDSRTDINLLTVTHPLGQEDSTSAVFHTSNKEVKTARKMLPPGYFDPPVIGVKTPHEMAKYYRVWQKRVARDNEYWHMNKESYNSRYKQ